MLVRERLPELGADLVAALAGLQCHYLAHLGRCRCLGGRGGESGGGERRQGKKAGSEGGVAGGSGVWGGFLKVERED